MTIRSHSDDYGRFRADLLVRIMAEKLKPSEVATILGEAADRFPEITYEECKRLRGMGDKWTA